MDIDWKKAADDVEAAVGFITSPTVTQLASLGGPSVAGVTKVVQGLAAITGDLIETASTAGTAIESGDLARIQAADATLQQQNIALAQDIAES